MNTMQYSRSARLLAAAALSCTSVSALLGACASDEDATPEIPDATVTLAPEDDAGGTEASADTGACASDDCEYFPTACAPGAMCPSGLFNTQDPTRGLDWRTHINVVTGRSATDVWYAGVAGAVGHFDGVSWKASDVGTRETQDILWFLGSAEVLIGTPNAPNRIYTRGLDMDAGSPPSEGGWTRQTSIFAPVEFWELTAAWSWPGSTTLWVGTTNEVWRVRRTPEATFEATQAIPSSVCHVAGCRSLRSLHGASSDTIWGVGDIGATVRITASGGSTPSATAVESNTWIGLRGVWAASDANVWAVGGAGTVLHYTGDALGWEQVQGVPTSVNLNAIWGTSPSDIWAVGDASVVLHYDGARWTRIHVAGLGDRRPALTTVWTPEPGRVWAGGDGILLALGETQ